MTAKAAAAAETRTLPGMEEREIADLEEKAREYLKIRNKRQDLTRREVELKTDLLGLMHKHKKKEYVHDGIEIQVVVEQESVKVKIHDDEPEEEKGE